MTDEPQEAGPQDVQKTKPQLVDGQNLASRLTEGPVFVVIKGESMDQIVGDVQERLETEAKAMGLWLHRTVLCRLASAALAPEDCAVGDEEGHCRHWEDGEEPCCRCGAPAMPEDTQIEAGMKEGPALGPLLSDPRRDRTEAAHSAAAWSGREFVESARPMLPTTEAEMDAMVEAARDQLDHCYAFIHHGPGHQSKTRCRMREPHTVHVALYGDNTYAEWTDGSYIRQLESGGYEIPAWVDKGTAMTGFFDEPPRGDDGE